MHIQRARLAAALVATACVAALSAAVSTQVARTAPVPDSFGARVAALSEPAGYFNTDNLISNERSYLHVAPQLRALAKQAAVGAYLGVGPDQNFSYIAQLRPAVAVIIDIRRDNLLLHLLFKAIFAMADTRADYLAILTGRAPATANENWTRASIDDIVRAIGNGRALDAGRIAMVRGELARVVDTFGVPLSDQDRATIDAFHRRFIADGLSLQFNTTGRAPQIGYPTYRDLLLERDLAGTQQSFLASEADYQFVKGLEARDLVIPAVGDLAGTVAMPAIGRFLAATNHPINVFYTSNVEFYLFRDGTFAQFMSNVGRLPHTPGSLMVRSVFPSGGAGPLLRPGYNSASITQPLQALIDAYAKGLIRQYGDLIR